MTTRKAHNRRSADSGLAPGIIGPSVVPIDLVRVDGQGKPQPVEDARLEVGATTVALRLGDGCGFVLDASELRAALGS